MPASVQSELFRKLSALGKVARYPDRDGEPEASALAYTICEVAESAEKIVNELLPAMKSTSDAEELEDLLFDFGEELRHILYHIRDSRYFDHLGAGENQ